MKYLLQVRTSYNIRFDLLVLHYIYIILLTISGRFLAFAGDDQLLKVLEENSHQIISIGQAHSSPITTLTWTPDEKQIISGGADSSLCIWNFYLGGV